MHCGSKSNSNDCSRLFMGWTTFRNEAILLQGEIENLSWGIESSWLIFRLYYWKNIQNFSRRERCSDGDYTKGFVTSPGAPETPLGPPTAEQDGGKLEPKKRLESEILLLSPVRWVLNQNSIWNRRESTPFSVLEMPDGWIIYNNWPESSCQPSLRE